MSKNNGGLYTLIEQKAPNPGRGLRLFLSPEALYAERWPAGSFALVNKDGGEGYIAQLWPLGTLKGRQALLTPQCIGSFATSDLISVAPVQREGQKACTGLRVLLKAIDATGGEHSSRAPPKKLAVLSPSMCQSTTPVSHSKETLRKDPLLAKMATDLVNLLVHRDKPQKSSRVKELLERYITGEMLGWIPLAGNEFKLQFLSVVVTCIVAQALPSGHGEVASSTVVSIQLDDELPSTAMGCALAAAEKHGAAAMSATKRALQQESSRGLDAVGGYDDTIRQLKELVLLPMTNASLFASVGLQLPRGVLLYGPPGTGKSLLARSLAHEAKATLFVVNGPETLSQYMGESESAIAGIFAAARALAPSIIFFDEADAVMAGRNVTQGTGSPSAASARLNLAIAQQLDALSGHPCIVLAATNRSETIDESLRRPGRFDREVEVGVPSPAERHSILQTKIKSLKHNLTAEEGSQFAANLHGFVGADIDLICRDAAMEALRRSVKDSECEGCVLIRDFNVAQSRIRPSALREFSVEIPTVRWDDIGGLDDAKQALKEMIELPFKNPELLSRVGVTSPQGILLYGPPGTAKTMLARAVATESNLNFINVDCGKIFNKYVGESEKNIQRVFQRARQLAPVVLFFDEIDALAGVRSADTNSVHNRLVSQLLQELDGVKNRKNVFVIAATNRVDDLDSALLRPGRFSRQLHIGLPDEKARMAILSLYCKELPLAHDVDLVCLVARTVSQSGAQLSFICRQAALCALEESLESEKIAMRHFESALTAEQGV